MAAAGADIYRQQATTAAVVVHRRRRRRTLSSQIHVFLTQGTVRRELDGSIRS